MIFLICVIVGLLLGGFIAQRYGSLWDTFGVGAFWGALFGCLAAFVLFLAGYFVKGDLEYTIADTKEIQCLNDNMGTTTRYYIFSGTSSDSLKYNYAYIDENGAIRVNSVDASKSAIIYTDEQPKLEVYNVRFANPVHRFLCPLVLNECRFYLPEGSVSVGNFDVDLR